MTHGAKRKQCSFEGCNKCAIKGGVCKRHCSESINIINNPASQAKGAVTPAIPPHQSICYDEEEELNSWIWRSNSHLRMQLYYGTET
jgi:hypothetical protein